MRPAGVAVAAAWAMLFGAAFQGAQLRDGDLLPAIKCYPVSQKYFECRTVNISKSLTPRWKLWTYPLSYASSGHEFSFYTPQTNKWQLIECRVDVGEETWIFRTEICRQKGKTIFRYPLLLPKFEVVPWAKTALRGHGCVGGYRFHCPPRERQQAGDKT